MENGVQRQYGLNHTIIFCTSRIFTAVSDSEWPLDIPPFSPGQKRQEHVQEALVKETVLNDEVAGSEQSEVLSVGRDVCYTTVFQTLSSALIY